MGWRSKKLSETVSDGTAGFCEWAYRLFGRLGTQRMFTIAPWPQRKNPSGDAYRTKQRFRLTVTIISARNEADGKITRIADEPLTRNVWKSPFDYEREWRKWIFIDQRVQLPSVCRTPRFQVNAMIWRQRYIPGDFTSKILFKAWTCHFSWCRAKKRGLERFLFAAPYGQIDFRLPRLSIVALFVTYCWTQLSPSSDLIEFVHEL